MKNMDRFIARSARVGSVLLSALGLLAVAGAPAATAAPVGATGFTVRTNARWVGVKDSQGRLWDHRAGFSGKINRWDNLANTPIAGTDDDVLYQSSLLGVSGYSAAVPNGVYRVRLLLVENYYKAAGQRIFDVGAEGRPVLTGVDIYKAAGRATAYDRTFDVTVLDSRLDLAFTSTRGGAAVSAIEIIGIGEAAAPKPTPTTPPTYGTPGTGGTGGLTLPTARRLIGIADRGGAGVAPVIVNGTGTSVFAARGGDARSEMFWGTSTEGALLASRYATVTSTFDIKHQLNDPATGAAPPAATWHTIFQMHGRTRIGTWPGPPLTISVQGGVYRVGGGASVPDTTGKLTYQGSWYQPYLPAPENEWRRFEVTTYLDGPGEGWVSVKVDGQPYIEKFYPKAGTIYVAGDNYSHAALNLKTGLYTAGSSPSWDRKVEMRNLSLRITEGASSRLFTQVATAPAKSTASTPTKGLVRGSSSQPGADNRIGLRRR